VHFVSLDLNVYCRSLAAVGRARGGTGEAPGLAGEEDMGCSDHLIGGPCAVDFTTVGVEEPSRAGASIPVDRSSPRAVLVFLLLARAHALTRDMGLGFLQEYAFRKPMLDWLAADLAKAYANRANVPWIIVGAHQPLCRLSHPDVLRSSGSACWSSDLYPACLLLGAP
jgi:hypothetical protein